MADGGRNLNPDLVMRGCWKQQTWPWLLDEAGGSSILGPRLPGEADDGSSKASLNFLMWLMEAATEPILLREAVANNELRPNLALRLVEAANLQLSKLGRF